MKCSAALAIFLLLGPAALPSAADDLDDAVERLKDAQTKNDAAAVKKAAVDVFAITCEVKGRPAPADAADKESWANLVEHAKGVEVTTEYALYATAIQKDQETMIDLISTLEQQSPKSKYLDDAYGPYIVALSKGAGGAKRANAVAEKALGNFPENEDLLLHNMSTAMAAKQPDRALSLANRLVAVMNKHAKPQTIQQADWDRKRNYALGQGYWTAGVISAEKGQYANADKNLRAALPLIKGYETMLAPALFQLGVANYQLGKMTLSKAKVLDGAKFSEQAATMDSPYMEQARRNALIMKQEAAGMR